MMNYDEWCEHYKPIKNHIDPNAGFGGEMFETYGAEVEFVKEQDPSKIWTVLTGDDGGLYLCSGWHYVNRLGYFVTEVPLESDKDSLEITVDDPEDREGEDEEPEDEE